MKVSGRSRKGQAALTSILILVVVIGGLIGLSYASDYIVENFKYEEFTIVDVKKTGEIVSVFMENTGVIDATLAKVYINDIPYENWSPKGFTIAPGQSVAVNILPGAPPVEKGFEQGKTYKITIETKAGNQYVAYYPPKGE